MNTFNREQSQSKGRENMVIAIPCQFSNPSSALQSQSLKTWICLDILILMKIPQGQVNSF